MIDVLNLTKRFGRTTAIDNISFSVARNEIVGFLGPNGAGKTTTMRVLSGYLPATGGTATVDGLDVVRDSLEVRRRIGYLPENVPLYSDMRVVEYMRYRGALKGLRGRRLRERIEAVAVCCELEDVQRTIIGRLSKGYRQRVGLADSLLHEPEVLILDEPTIGLDPNQIRNIRYLIKNLSRRHTVLLSTHILHEAEMLCERVLIMNQGRIIASDTTANLVGLLQGNVRVAAEIRGPRDDVQTALQGLPGVKRVTVETVGEWHQVVCEAERGSDVREDVFRVVGRRMWSLRELSAERQNLEDVFVALTNDADGNIGAARQNGEGQAEEMSQ